MKNKHIILCTLEFLICSCSKNYYQVAKVIESIKNFKEKQLLLQYDWYTTANKP